MLATSGAIRTAMSVVSEQKSIRTNTSRGVGPCRLLFDGTPSAKRWSDASATPRSHPDSSTTVKGRSSRTPANVLVVGGVGDDIGPAGAVGSVVEHATNSTAA